MTGTWAVRRPLPRPLVPGTPLGRDSGRERSVFAVPGVRRLLCVGHKRPQLTGPTRRAVVEPRNVCTWQPLKCLKKTPLRVL